MKQIQEVLDWLGKRLKKIILRGDSAFLSQEVTDTVHGNGHHFALVMPAYPNLNEIASQLPPNLGQNLRLPLKSKGRNAAEENLNVSGART